MIKKTFLVFLTLTVSTGMWGQKTSFNWIPVDSTHLDSLNNLGLSFLTSKDQSKRISAEGLFDAHLEALLNEKDAFYFNFDSLKCASHLVAPDSSFKLFTWQLYLSEDKYLYKGLIQKRNGDLIKLEDKSDEYLSAEFETGDPSFWYGSFYYNLLPFTSKSGEQLYLLFGFDGNALMERRKVIEVMKFEDDQVYFGQPVFLKTLNSPGHPPTKMRVILEYFAASSVKCNYEEPLDRILFDHLTFTKTPHGEFLIPDGTYEGYEYKDGVWYHVPKMFHEVLMDAPRPEPVFSDKAGEGKLDIHGKNRFRSHPDEDEIERKKKKLKKSKKKEN